MDFIRHQIADGINLYLCETDKFTTLTVKVFVQNSLTAETAAANALIPMVLVQGTRSNPTRLSLAQKMENLYGSALGADVAKIGERQIMEFYFDMVAPHLIPNGDQVLAEGLATLGELITDPLVENGSFKQEYFQQEKTNLGKLVDGLINDKRAYAVWRAVKHMCKDEPFGLYKYGEREQIDQLQPEFVYQQYRRALASSPIDIFAVGPKLDQLPEMIRAWQWQRTTVQQLPPVTTKRDIREQEIHETRDVQQAVLVICCRTEQQYLSPDYYALMVANGVLGVYPHSKLFLNVREKASLAYYVGSSLEGTKGLITITAGIAPQAYQQAVDIIREQVAAMQAGSITDDELERTKIGLISGIRSMVDDPGSLIDRNLIGIVNQELRTPQTVMDSIAAVTKEQVQQAAQGIKLDTIYFLSGPKGEN